ncbi:diguanylate cyclase (GGDEF)-like protein [Agrobacterium tumefaciens]|uniref:GGDEF domain-containing protein n=1 Tax=Agrobacterium tumefaciens TaxID=358 RepID=UPI0013A6F17F|nr:sensor domain-containing diguanylate cyclase [Agrobacterium tumefaciens]MBP2507178.1 diguanylate cyclase (GGDEF)-like protein [Agrobacterium tumefaciens]MBP2516420.1 diguanylate cyclase (GGDEF)-like protein [Agrobacterium tumefaciens]MBP2575053.1 diguanylate cyclase (GGDEF)-like protein [Agrobacterium tumefaciens]MBP2593320.1 diguanylate cyclase (GGDEF)-like protein [Agrobacterium tumefaciens]
MSRKPARSTLEDVSPARNARVRGDADSFNRHLMDLMEASQQGYALFDGGDELRFANTAFRTALGLGPDEFPTWVELMRSGYRNSAGTAIETSDFELWLRSARTRRGKLPFRTIETGLNDGRWMLTTETTLPGGWMLCVVTDISELGVELRDLRQERDRALKSALSDELTGLGNRRYVMDILNHRLGPNKAEALAVIIIDIDHFKSVNDRFGHACGDLVLKDFAARLSAAVARDDLVGRIGGEEFLLVFGGSRMLSAEIIMQKLLLSLTAASPLSDVPDFRYSCSAGIAFANPVESASDVLRRADTALYEAKNTGRNRYVIYGAAS